MDEKVRSELDRGADRVRDGLQVTSDATTQIFKARQDFYQHLMLLNAGTLSLLFTVVLALAASKQFSVFLMFDNHHLLYGCYLLVGSIVLSLIHNHFNISQFTHHKLSHVSRSVGSDIARLYATLQNITGEPHDASSASALEEKGKVHSRYSVPIERAAIALGVTAQVLTVVAYVDFMLALKAVFESIPR